MSVRKIGLLALAVAGTVILARPILAQLGDGLDDWCTKATLPSSIAICSDDELRRLALSRQRAFDEARERLENEGLRAALLADQNDWVKTYAATCGLTATAPPLPLDKTLRDCMANAGRARITYLQGYGKSTMSAGAPTPLVAPATASDRPPAVGQMPPACLTGYRSIYCDQAARDIAAQQQARHDWEVKKETERRQREEKAAADAAAAARQAALDAERQRRERAAQRWRDAAAADPKMADAVVVGLALYPMYMEDAWERVEVEEAKRGSYSLTLWYRPGESVNQLTAKAATWAIAWTILQALVKDGRSPAMDSTSLMVNAMQHFQGITGTDRVAWYGYTSYNYRTDDLKYTACSNASWFGC